MTFVKHVSVTCKGVTCEGCGGDMSIGVNFVRVVRVMYVRV